MVGRAFMRGWLVTVAAAAVAGEIAAAVPQQRPPNVVLIFVDNLGNGDLGCTGSALHRTPNLDRLAAEGTRYTSFYVGSGVCTPSRAALMTGCYPPRVGMHVNGKNGAVLFPADTKGLNPEETTMAEVMKSAGYATAIFGKWHLGDQPPFLPTRQGFDTFFGIPYSDDMVERPKQGWPPLPLMRDERVVEAPADRHALVRRCTEEAVAFIGRNRERPFFVYLPYTTPGSTASPHAGTAFSGKSRNGAYGDSVEELDWAAGELLAALARLGLERDTLVIWTSDNGAVRRDPPQGSCAPYKGFGYDTSEGAMRVPCLMRWPGRIPSGRVCDEVCSTLDLLPTFAALAGAALPQRPVDGRDIRSLLFGMSGDRSPWDEKGFCYFRMEQLQAVRAGPWKLYLPLEKKIVSLGRATAPAKLELYDVRNDVGETREVSAEQPQVVQRLLALAEAARGEIGDVGRPAGGVREAGRVEASSPVRLEPQGLPTPRPNVLWIIAEDLGLDLRCYGNRDARTPNLDALASQGRLYRRAYSTSSVCSPSRSALHTGMYQTAIGAHHHRSHRDDNFELPAGVRLITDRLREAGYFTAQVSKFPAEAALPGKGKIDWNFKTPDKPFDSERWEDLKAHQPFYAQINISETHRIYRRAKTDPADPAKVTLPPYLPDHPVTREDWALYLDAIQTLDDKVGRILALLDKDGLGANTVVFFFGDNGRECFRGKYFAYEQGCQVPLLVRWPGRLPAGSTCEDLVSLIDVTATTLSVAGVPVPKEMHGQPFLGPCVRPRAHLFTALDRVGTKVDRVRTVRDARYKYIRNFFPEEPYLPASLPYADETNPNFRLMRQLFAEGRLSEAQSKFMARTRPAEELYDLENDPYEFDNLAGKPLHAEVLSELRKTLDQWMTDTDDQGRVPEDPATQKRIIDALKRSVEASFRNLKENAKRVE